MNGLLDHLNQCMEMKMEIYIYVVNTREFMKKSNFKQ